MPKKARTPAMPDSLYVYCTVILSQSNYHFTKKSDRNGLKGVAIGSTTILACDVLSEVAGNSVSEWPATGPENQGMVMSHGRSIRLPSAKNAQVRLPG